MVPQNRFRDLVEAALRVEKSTTTMYQSRQESKRSAPGTSQAEGPVPSQAEAAMVEAELVPQGCRQRPVLRPGFML